MLVFSGASFADEGTVTVNLTNGKNIFENGKADEACPACATCHGDKAMGNDAMGSPQACEYWICIYRQATDEFC